MLGVDKAGWGVKASWLVLKIRGPLLDLGFGFRFWDTVRRPCYKKYPKRDSILENYLHGVLEVIDLQSLERIESLVKSIRKGSSPILERLPLIRTRLLKGS